jgi:hypothetical protein
MKIKSKKEKENPKKDGIKYHKPKILLIDLPSELTNKLKSSGFNVSAGTFGSPYKVEVSDEYQPVIPNPNLPNFSEQEIIIIDLTLPQILDVPKGKKVRSEGETDWWAKCSLGFIDPRPYVMSWVQEAFNRILAHDGLFVVFAQPRLYQSIYSGKMQLNQLQTEEYVDTDNWSFLSILSNLVEIKEDYGTEIFLQEQRLKEFYFIKETLKDAQFTATIKFKYHYANDFKTILKNKYVRIMNMN